MVDVVVDVVVVVEVVVDVVVVVGSPKQPVEHGEFSVSSWQMSTWHLIRCGPTSSTTEVKANPSNRNEKSHSILVVGKGSWKKREVGKF